MNNPSLKITSVEKSSLAETAGFLPEDQLVSINGHIIRDIIDFQFYSADEILDCIFRRDQSEHCIKLNRPEGKHIGLDFEQMRFRKCGNHCLFCFVDQNPDGVRESLKFKDEDYRLSFLHGNYITLTAVTQSNLDRIVEQRLSPLYISIHATDPSVRRKLLGLNKNDHLIEKIQFLTEQDIELHGQIVLCKRLNDGGVLETSIDTLSSFFPKLRSLAIVPVGLTQHRIALPKLESYDRESAKIVLKIVKLYQSKFTKQFGEPFVYLADELYLLSGMPLPPCAHYGDFWQIENGVGMTSSFLKEFNLASKSFPYKLKQSLHLFLITGVLAAPTIKKHVLPRLRQIGNLHVDLKVVENTFFGPSVTVSGLLVGNDILKALKKEKNKGIVILPSNCLNIDNFFLDDVSLQDFSRRLNRKVIVTNQFSDFWNTE